MEEARADLPNRLRERRQEVEQAILTRIYALLPPMESLDAEYLEGMRMSVSAALDYGLDAMELGEERSPPIPVALLVQARVAARSGVSLDAVLRHYLAGYTLLNDFLIGEAEARASDLQGVSLQYLTRTQASVFDRLVASVSEEYAREAKGRVDSSEQRRAERIKRLLAGELLDTSDLRYNFDASHLGVIATGGEAVEAIRDLAQSLDCQCLSVRRDDETVWAWLGARDRINPADVQRFISLGCPTHISLALGEPGQGLGGWRLTHHQARAALPIALRSPERSIRYADVALLATMLQDDLLATSLRRLYLAPLESERDGGKVARETLRAYIAAGRNVTSAAAALGVTRRTIANRLRSIESKVGRSLNPALAEIESVLRLQEFEDAPMHQAAVAKEI